MRKSQNILLSAAVASLVVGCRSNSLLDEPTPVGEVTNASIVSSSGASAAFLAAQMEFVNALAGISPNNGEGGLLLWSELLSDEFFAQETNFYPTPCPSEVDARYTAGYGDTDNCGLNSVEVMLLSRSAFLVAVPSLQTYEVGSSASLVGETYGLIGYTELKLAEDFCSGAVLDHIAPAGGVVFTPQFTSDSLLGVAEAHFDSALKYAYGNDTVTYLASVGMGRALLDRGRFDSAASVVANVPVSFEYDLVFSTYNDLSNNKLNEQVYACASGPCISNGRYGAGYWDVADREGGVGVNFISAHDPRLILDSTDIKTVDGVVPALLHRHGEPPDSLYYAPLKFGNPPSAGTTIPLATGVEAQLIIAEAALHDQNTSTWAATLNGLRANAQTTYLQLDSAVHPLQADSTTDAPDTAQVSLMFRERAFWLFGLGSRLSDMRRLIRQYGRPVNAVFPSGAYGPAAWFNLAYQATYIPTYGTDVSISLPLANDPNTTEVNPSYKGCLLPTSTA